MTDNMRIWDQVCHTDKEATSRFKRAGGFGGTSIDPMYQISRATKMFGPMGDKWGVEITGEHIVEVKSGEKLHYVYIKLWYHNEEGKRCEIPQVGQTLMLTNGRVVEEAPKMSLTDALTKALSWLGFSADIWLGEFDGEKRQAQRQQPTKPHPYTKPVNAAILGPEQMTALREKLHRLIIETGAESGAILGYYKVSDTDEMSVEQLQHAIGILEKRK